MATCSRVLIGLLAWGALSFGAAYPWAYWPLAVGCLGIGLWSTAVTRAWREPRPRRMAWTLGIVAMAVSIQIIPLPYHWFRDVSPAADAALSQLKVGWALQPPAWHSLSIDPAGTFTALMLFLAFGLLLVGLMRAVSYMPLEWIVTQLTIFGLVMALFGIVQRVIAGPGDVPVYGFWRASGYALPFGPFINRNHYAGWMVLVLPLALASASARAQAARGPFRHGWRDWLQWLVTPDASRFVFLAVAVLLMAVALVLTGSRSGLASLIVAMGALGCFAWQRARAPARRILPVLYLGLFVIVAIGWVGIEWTVSRFDDAAPEFGERMAAWRDTWRMVRDFPVVGVGVGAYGLAMLVYQTADRHSIYVQAHNDYLQILAEGGALVAVPVLLAIGTVVVSIRHRFHGQDPAPVYWLRSGATAGLIGMAAQSLLDFSLQMPGNAMMFTVLLAIALHRPSQAAHAHRL